MRRADRLPPPDRDGYLQQTQRPLHCLALVICPLVFYQLAGWKFGHDVVAPHDLGRILGFFGATAWFLPGLLIVVVLVLQHIAHGYRLDIRPTVLLGMLAESVAWVVPLYCLSYLNARLLAAGATGGPTPAMTLVLQSIGAGIFEEFIFRLTFISLVLVVLVDLFEFRRDACVVAAVVAGAVLFSAYHLTWEQLTGPGAIPWGDSAFRVLAGVYLGALYVKRGYGIAVGVHTIWNLYAFSSG
jgi:hypothetical protein